MSRAADDGADDGLDELRADLARFVLREAGQAVAQNPDLPLSVALTQAIHEEAELAARRNRDMQPTPDDLAASIMTVLRPQLVEVVRAAAEGDAGSLGRRGLGGLSPAIAAIFAAVALLVAFGAGFGLARLLQPTPEPEPVAEEPVLPPVVAAPEGEAPAPEGTDPAQTIPAPGVAEGPQS